MPENWPVVQLFLASATQWRRAGMSGVLSGFDYCGVEAAARMAMLKVTPETFAGLRVMESATITAMRERQS